VDAWQLANWEEYRDVARLGRKTRLPEAQRRVLWSIFERVRAELQSRRLITYAALFTSLAATISKNRGSSHCGPARAPADQAVAEGADQGTG
jgi:hypothetical protein